MVNNPFVPASSSVDAQGKASIFSSAATPDVSSHTVTQIDINKLRAFHNHPFKVLDDTAMAELMASIERNGIHTPVIVRALDSDNGMFELISGHRRVHAARKLGLERVPAIVVHADDDRATIMMVDANLNRPSLLFSERAKSMYQRYQAMMHQGVKTDSAHTTAQVLAQQFNTSEVSIRRLASFGRLPDSLLVLIDYKRMGEKFARMLISLDGNQLAVFDNYMRVHRDVKAKNTFLSEFLAQYNQTHEVSEKMLDHVFHSVTAAPVVRLAVPLDWFAGDVSTPADALETIRRALTAYKKED